mgnify:CR=1 FL=1
MRPSPQLSAILLIHGHIPHATVMHLDAASHIIRHNRLLLRRVRRSRHGGRSDAEQLAHNSAVDGAAREGLAAAVCLALRLARGDGRDGRLGKGLVVGGAGGLGAACVCRGGGGGLLLRLRLVLVLLRLLLLLLLFGGRGGGSRLLGRGGGFGDLGWFGLVVGLGVGGGLLLGGGLGVGVAGLLCVIGAGLLLGVVLGLSSWVAGGGDNAGNGGAGLVVGDEVGAGLLGDQGGGDREELALDRVVDQAEAEGLAAGGSIALGLAVRSSLDASWLLDWLVLGVAASWSGAASVGTEVKGRSRDGGEERRSCDDGGEGVHLESWKWTENVQK